LSARFGAHRTVGFGMLCIATGLLLFTGLSTHTAYAYVVLCVVPLTTGIALSMSPMTASIMSAVPPRRAGAGSAMNDATRELGAALGIAVLGSVAASRYASSVAPSLRGLSKTDQASARTSIAGALHVASSLRAPASDALVSGAQHAFVNGIHLAVVVGAMLAIISAGIVWRKLPPSLSQHGALHGPVEALEEVAALGLGGVPPVFADEQRDEERALEHDRKVLRQRDQARS
jgi:hypothetical protein